MINFSNGGKQKVEDQIQNFTKYSRIISTGGLMKHKLKKQLAVPVETFIDTSEAFIITGKLLINGRISFEKRIA